MCCGELSSKDSRGIKKHVSISGQEALSDAFPPVCLVGGGDVRAGMFFFLIIHLSQGRSLYLENN